VCVCVGEGVECVGGVLSVCVFGGWGGGGVCVCVRVGVVLVGVMGGGGGDEKTKINVFF